MHQHEVAQGFIERCQARSTDLSGDLLACRIHRSNLCDYPRQQVVMLLGKHLHTLPANVSSPTVPKKR